jgi:putative oxidoreductase
MTRLNALQPLGLLLLRLAIALIFIYHGYPKLAHPGSMDAMFIQHGLPGYFATIAGVFETFGGGLIIIGLFTRAAALVLALEMAVALWKVHLVGGIMAVRNYEFPLMLAVSCFALATVGAGMASADYALFAGGGKTRRGATRAK